jgi:hypothetical protein
LWPASWPWSRTLPIAELKPLIPHGELRAIAREDERAAQDQRRLRMELLSPFGAALEIARDGLGAPTRLRLWARGPPPVGLASATREEL